MTVLVGDEVDRQPQVSETSRAANAVEVGLSVLGEVEVDHHVDRLDVDTTGEQVYAKAKAAAGGKGIGDEATLVSASRRRP